VRAPTPRYLDRNGEIFATPAVVVDYVEGETPAVTIDATELVNELASVLAEVHRVPAGDLSFLPRRELASTTASAAADERLIRNLLESALPLPPRNRSVLLHGDFWPGNSLWNDGRLVAVIDWEDAAIGDPLADVANTRLELTWAIGLEAMEEFTRQYGSNVTAVDFTDLPYWDLWADLRLARRTADWSLDAAQRKAMREGHEAFVAQALARLIPHA
jgi:aminoglycoside phosphotransferase (APT) family kinase protein